MRTHTITTSWVKIDGEDRLRIGIDLEHDFATIYLHPETVESLRVALGAIPARPASGPRFWDVVIDGAKPVRAVGDNEDDAIGSAIQHLFPEAYEVRPTEDVGDFEAKIDVNDKPVRMRFTATATPATTERA
jgi:hypothetical protein